MRIKRKNGLKMIVIALVLLLCLALAVGITGAYYQAKRQATGTLNMDQGIIIDYNGFDKTTAEEWATWTREVTLPLFETNNAQPGEHIAVNAAGIRANAKSVDFYARVKLSYKFYNNDTEVTLANASDLITTSANFFGTNWVDGGSSDGYYYYATGTSLNKFNKGTQTFVDLFATDAEFIIEGENFTGATSNGEGGGFVVGDTSINKIEVYLTLETLQGDVQTEELNTMGWKIASEVDFAKVDEGKIVTSVNGGIVNESLNVTIDDTTTSLETVKFPYGEKTILEFDSPNVEYMELTYSDGTKSEKFYDKQETGNSKIEVLADETRGSVTGYTVGWFSSKEYTGFTFSNKICVTNGSGSYDYKDLNDGEFSINKYWGTSENIKIESKVKLRQRNFEVVSTTCATAYDLYFALFDLGLEKDETFEVVEFNQSFVLNEKSENSIQRYLYSSGLISSSTFKDDYPVLTVRMKKYVETSSIFYSSSDITAIWSGAFENNTNIKIIDFADSITRIGYDAFNGCSNLETKVGEGWYVNGGDELIDKDTLLKDVPNRYGEMVKKA